MHGNVQEWCEDWYGMYTGGEETNPQGHTDRSYRVIRGGSWRSKSRGYMGMGGYCRVADRGRFEPGYRCNDYGFRLVLPLEL